MRVIGLALVGLLWLLTGSAFAAGSTPVNWSGAYVGAVAGYGWDSNTYHYDFIDSLHVDFDSNGFVGGVSGGYNWQIGQFVLGAEGDISYANLKGSALTSDGEAPCFIEGCTAKVTWFGTGRARLGYAFENFLPYATAGFAVGHIKGSADNGACGNSNCLYDDTRWGWTAGGGVEWAMNQQLSFKAEYLHVDLGTPHFNGGRNPTTEAIGFNTVRVGINYHF